MKTSIKLIIAGAIIAVVVAGVLISKHFFRADQDDHFVQVTGDAEGTTPMPAEEKNQTGQRKAEYTSISMDEAKEVFATPGDYIILDVRRADEFAGGHIPGAINVANEDIGSEQPAELPDLDRVIYVYCRSGRRSKDASAKLAAIGYTNIYEFGGILDWDGEIEK